MTRRGMTLIEMMIALSATLLLMAAVAQVFAVFGGAISGSRAVLDLDGRMRTAAWRLRTDLAGITARTVPGGEVAAILVVPARRAGAVRVLSANLDPALVEPVAQEGVEWVRAG